MTYIKQLDPEPTNILAINVVNGLFIFVALLMLPLTLLGIVMTIFAAIMTYSDPVEANRFLSQPEISSAIYIMAGILVAIFMVVILWALVIRWLYYMHEEK